MNQWLHKSRRPKKFWYQIARHQTLVASTGKEEQFFAPWSGKGESSHMVSTLTASITPLNSQLPNSESVQPAQSENEVKVRRNLDFSQIHSSSNPPKSSSWNSSVSVANMMALLFWTFNQMLGFQTLHSEDFILPTNATFCLWLCQHIYIVVYVNIKCLSMTYICLLSSICSHLD